MELGFVRDANDLGYIGDTIFELGLNTHSHGFEHTQIAVEQLNYGQIATLICIDQLVQIGHYGFCVHQKF